MSIDYTGEYNNTYGDINVRINGAPIDVSEIFLTEDEAQRYANGELISSKGKPYAGQKISIKVSEETNENGETYGIYKVYVIQGDRTITEVGKDFIAGTNIDITDNTISAKGYVYNEEKKSFAEGSRSNAEGAFSHAEGISTNASGLASHAEGHSTAAYGRCSHTEGYYTGATGYASHAEGDTTTAAGETTTTASGETSASETTTAASETTSAEETTTAAQN